MFTNSNYDVELFHKGSNLTNLKHYDIIITATGVPELISNEMISPGTVVVDAGTASENGRLKGDVANEVRARKDLTAITPITGGVGPLTIAALFDHTIQASS
jgi:methylenetetrahydrofolate dehydrogenase (NADP+)/methenyltetrahydrofolate cyclohydrolase